MNLWKFKGFITSRGVNVVKEWCDDVPDGAWLAFGFTCDYLSGQPIQNWKRPWTDTLEGGKRGRKKGCVGLVELRFDFGNIEYRPLGYFSGEMEFTILLFAEERGGEFVPPTACQIAKSHISIIEADRRRAREFIIPEDDS
jgi:hypothetical protein